ncbi:hypothetical protein [Candidatus Paracaedibacter symbiosus]|uniref:hypothetical protein n=1 Tax=Candidatus Paracaedibacter symbiosus TaxID=244582 RepID=UPI0006901B46|nr:hypothetical protein [Candidatus Paracaedibacter symbiosus]
MLGKFLLSLSLALSSTVFATPDEPNEKIQNNSSLPARANVWVEIWNDSGSASEKLAKAKEHYEPFNSQYSHLTTMIEESRYADIYNGNEGIKVLASDSLDLFKEKRNNLEKRYSSFQAYAENQSTDTSVSPPQSLFGRFSGESWSSAEERDEYALSKAERYRILANFFKKYPTTKPESLKINLEYLLTRLNDINKDIAKSLIGVENEKIQKASKPVEKLRKEIESLQAPDRSLLNFLEEKSKKWGERVSPDFTIQHLAKQRKLYASFKPQADQSKKKIGGTLFTSSIRTENSPVQTQQSAGDVGCLPLNEVRNELYPSMITGDQPRSPRVGDTPTGGIPASPRREEQTPPASPREEQTPPASPSREEQTPPASPREEQTPPASPSREEQTPPASPSGEEQTPAGFTGEQTPVVQDLPTPSSDSQVVVEQVLTS